MLQAEDYDKIPLDVYKEIYNEAKAKFEETKSQSSTITERSIKIILAVFGLSAWAASLIPTTISPLVVACIIIYVLILAAITYYLIPLFYNRDSPLKGTYPKVIYGDDGLNLSQEEGFVKVDEVFYFHQIERYERKIRAVELENSMRGGPLKKATVASMGLVIYLLVAFVVIKTSVF